MMLSPDGWREDSPLVELEGRPFIPPPHFQRFHSKHRLIPLKPQELEPTILIFVDGDAARLALLHRYYTQADSRLSDADCVLISEFERMISDAHFSEKTPGTSCVRERLQTAAARYPGLFTAPE